ncbi:heat shock factor protein 1 isoform X7 [Nannospalax galili]|uniref:heat shock factor protein 1 isoform X7 n=1 Tax=Nannospalax galili TaxID=1026970 RepID=UPI00111C787F|nr:heat shock factor protein 1 isoform X7 [Nannospalax galili]
MDLAVGPGTAGPSNVPAFLTKLWTLVSDPDTDALICWSPSGNSFHVFDQGQFAKEVLPKYFKHNNMASFVRQLNMYGFRKVVHIEQGGLVKPERDDTEFQHPCFLRGQEQLLENIKRKVTSVSTLKSEDIKIRQDSVTKLLTDVQLMKGKQECMDSKLLAMKHENEALWREVASLRQKHAQQQKVVNKLIQFLISLVQSNRILGVKRKMPLSSSPLVRIKEEPPSPPQSPRVEEASPGHPSSMDTPLSPTAFIDSILRESEPTPAASTTAPADTGARALVPPPPSTPEKCLSVACLDNLARAPQMSGVARLFPCPSSSFLHGRVQPGNELSDHLDAMDSNLDNLQTMLTSHGFSVDTSALLDLFSPSVTMPDMSLPDLDSSLASIQELLSPQEPPRPIEAENSSPDSGKQLVHYTAQPLFLLDPDAVDTGSSELPVLFELGEGSYFSEGDDYTDDPTISLLTGSEPPKAKDPTVS